MLVLFLVLGHACELPAYADFVSHGPEDVHHTADHHADEHLLSCDAAVGVSTNTGYLQVSPILDGIEVSPVAELAPVRVGPRSRADSKMLSSRPPLFLLHASLLI